MDSFFPLLLLAVVLLPSIIEAIFAKQYPVHTQGIVVVTGASSGIGLAAARALDAGGYTVYAGVRKAKDAEMVESLGGSLRGLIMDVTNEESCVKAAETVAGAMKKEGLPLVGLVNNAGVSRRLPFELVRATRAGASVAERVRAGAREKAPA
jgi:NAD(P)-dependent dehydrogenase (short-subunit alcohol dehydrogenase family)